MVIRPVASAHVNASHPALLRFDGGSKLKVLSLGARLNSFAKNNGSAAARSTAICFLLRSSPRWNVATALSSSRLEKSQPRDEAGAIGTFRLRCAAQRRSFQGGGTSSGLGLPLAEATTERESILQYLFSLLPGPLHLPPPVREGNRS